MPQAAGIRTYVSQVLIYNHALLSLWTEAVWLLVADLDEFLMTPSPVKSIEQVMRHHLLPPSTRGNGEATLL